jgi:hypothetical protein
MPSSPSKINQSFGGVSSIHLQNRIIGDQHEVRSTCCYIPESLLWNKKKKNKSA